MRERAREVKRGARQGIVAPIEPLMVRLAAPASGSPLKTTLEKETARKRLAD